MIIKVCGMRDAENIREVEALGIDWLGLIFWPRSSRYVSERPAYLPTACKRVGVFVDEAPDTLLRLTDDYALGAVQLHGHERPAALKMFRSFHDDCIVIKAFNIATAADFAQTLPYEGLADYFLFDTKGRSVGGNGQKFDWTVLADYAGATPYLLSGGIGPDDAERVRTFLASHGAPAGRCAGIDLNSRFELAPAYKDIHQLKQFIAQL